MRVVANGYEYERFGWICFQSLFFARMLRQCGSKGFFTVAMGAGATTVETARMVLVSVEVATAEMVTKIVLVVLTVRIALIVLVLIAVAAAVCVSDVVTVRVDTVEGVGMARQEQAAEREEAP
jgi:hypothetical protein